MNLTNPVQNPGRLTLDANHNYYYTQAASGDTPQVYVTESPLGYTVQDTIAGNGTAGFSGDDGPPTKAELNGAAGLAIDACGSIYVADALNGRIRKILNTNTASTAQCTNGGSGGSGGGVATFISLTATPGQQVTAPGTITFDSTVNLINCPACTGPLTGEVFFCYVAAPSTNGCGIGSTPLGAVLLDGPSPTEAAASLTTSFAIPGTYYVAAEYADAKGTYPSSTAVTLQITVCGTACIDPGVPNIPVSPYPVAFTPGQVVIGFVSPGVVAFDSAGNTYFLNSGAGTVTRLDTQGGSTQIVPGSLATGLSNPSDMVLGSDGNLYITDTGNNRIIQVASPAGASPTVDVITPSLSPGLNSPTGIFETSSEVYVSDTGNQRVVAFRTNGTFPSVLFSAQTKGAPPIGSLEGIVVNPTTLEIYVANAPLGGIPPVGNILEATIGGTPSVLPMPAGVTLRSPYGLALDPANGLYFSDTGTRQIYRMDVYGNVIVVAGNGTAVESNVFGESPVSATQTGIENPTWLALDTTNSIWFSDTYSVPKVNVTQSAVNFTASGETQTIYVTDPVSGTQGAVAVELPSPLLTGSGSGDFSVLSYSTCVPASPEFPVTNLSPNTSCTIVVTYAGGSSATASIAVPSEIEVSPGSFSVSAEQTQTINLNGTVAAGTTPLVITPPNSLSGTAGSLYGPAAFEISGGSGVVTLTESGALPAGMNLSKSGVLSGTPGVTGSFPFTVTATDSQGDVGTVSPTLTINCPTITVSPSSLPNGTVGQAYGPVTFSETGGLGTISFAANPNPVDGLSFIGATLSGNPVSGPGPFTLLVTATDSNACSGFVIDYLTVTSSTPPPPSPVNINISETITVNDAPSLPEVSDAENLTVTDTPFVAVSPAPLATSAPVAYFSVASLGFNTTTAGQIATQTFALSNIGGGQLNLRSESISSSPPFSLVSIACTNGAASLSTVLMPSDACFFTVQYVAPSSPATGSITFTDNAPLNNIANGSSTQTIPLSGSQQSDGAAPSAPSVTVTIPTISENITVDDTVNPPPSVPLFVTIGSKLGSLILDPTNNVEQYIATLSLSNGGNIASGVQVTSATLNGASSTSLPIALSLGPSGAANVTLNFPSSAGASGAHVVLSVQGTYSTVVVGGKTLNGSWTGNFRVTLPASSN